MAGAGSNAARVGWLGPFCQKFIARLDGARVEEAPQMWTVRRYSRRSVAYDCWCQLVPKFLQLGAVLCISAKNGAFVSCTALHTYARH